MFALRVHSVDTTTQLAGKDDLDFTATTTSSSQSNPNPNFNERRGFIHLFRTLNNNDNGPTPPRSCLLFVVAVPNYMSSADFIRFCGSYADSISELSIIRNDGMEDRYSVVIQFADQLKAYGFYCSFNGNRFSPAETEVCHILFALSVDYIESSEMASIPPKGFTELPTCPVCLERLDQDTGGILSTVCDHSYQCSCTSRWTHLSCQVCRLCQQQDDKPSCFICGTVENLWVCLICGFLGCGRYKDGHAIRHWKNTEHCYSLDLETQQVWDYVGDTYVHRLNQSKADGKSAMMSSHCMSLEGNCGSCVCSEDSEISGALYSSKIEADIKTLSRNKFNVSRIFYCSREKDYRRIQRLLATQLETRRQYYESQLFEEKSKKEAIISEAVEQALTSKMQEMQDEIEKRVKEKKLVAEINEKLMNNQEVLRKNVKEMEASESSLLKSKDEHILDLDEQIRDLTIYIEAQKTIGSMTETDDVREGTVMPVPMKQSSKASTTKRQIKSNRRRN